MSSRISGVLLATAIFALPGCAETASDDGQTIRFSEGDSNETEMGAFAVRAWTENGSMDGGACFFRIGMPLPDGEDGRGIPGLALEVLAGADLDSAESMDLTVTYEGDGVYRADGLHLDGSDATLRVQISATSVADAITYSVG